MTLLPLLMVLTGATADVAAAARATQCMSDTCTSLGACVPSSRRNVESLACFAALEGKTCADAIEQAKANGKSASILLSPGDQAVIRVFYRKNQKDISTCPWPEPTAIQKAWLDAAVALGERGTRFGGREEWGLQVLPTVTVGLPLWVGGDGPANDALEDFPSAGGLLVRGTPVGFWASLHAFAAAGSVKSSKLPPEYSNPSMLLLGAGVDFLGGSIGVSYVHAQLKKTGRFERTGDSTDFVQLGVDLTPLLVSLTGLRK